MAGGEEITHRDIFLSLSPFLPSMDAGGRKGERGVKERQRRETQVYAFSILNYRDCPGRE